MTDILNMSLYYNQVNATIYLGKGHHFYFDCTASLNSTINNEICDHDYDTNRSLYR